MIRERIRKTGAMQKLLAASSVQTRNSVLSEAVRILQKEKEKIFQANEEDIEAAEREGTAAPLIKRLKFDEHKLQDVCSGMNDIIGEQDPLSKVLIRRELDAGLILEKRTCPIGVIGMIFESRPDALIQIASLCLKSGNAVVLKGGREAARTNAVLAECFRKATVSAGNGLRPEWIELMESREDVQSMLTMDEEIDLIIPRGSKEFVRYIMDHSRIPVLGHADGVCHIYIDEEFDLQKSVDVAVDAKCQYPAACNAVETVLVHRNAAEKVLPALAEALESRGVEIRGDEMVRSIISCTPAAESDWAAEYLDLILSVKIADSLEDAVQHIHAYGSGHTEAIMTENRDHAEYFLNAVDASGVYWNCSTRFADGYRYGLGAEVGISTGKIHARGPVGLEGLLSWKWLLRGDGHTAGMYSGKQGKKFTHKDLSVDE